MAESLEAGEYKRIWLHELAEHLAEGWVQAGKPWCDHHAALRGDGYAQVWVRREAT